MGGFGTGDGTPAGDARLRSGGARRGAAVEPLVDRPPFRPRRESARGTPTIPATGRSPRGPLSGDPVGVGRGGAAVRRAVRLAEEHRTPGTAAVYPGDPAPVPRTLIDVIEATAAVFPRAAAIDDGRRTLGYAAVLDEVDRLAVRLA